MLPPPEFQDTYTEALEQIIEAKREHREPPALPEPEGESGRIVDLMAALTQSVQKARADRGEDADVHDMPKKKITAKKQPARKTAVRKTSTRKPRRSVRLERGRRRRVAAASSTRRSASDDSGQGLRRGRGHWTPCRARKALTA
ncbi:hypothetical protein GCM10027074_75220 [Streptomyces deserti]